MRHDATGGIMGRLARQRLFTLFSNITVCATVSWNISPETRAVGEQVQRSLLYTSPKWCHVLQLQERISGKDLDKIWTNPMQYISKVKFFRAKVHHLLSFIYGWLPCLGVFLADLRLHHCLDLERNLTFFADIITPNDRLSNKGERLRLTSLDRAIHSLRVQLTPTAPTFHVPFSVALIVKIKKRLVTSTDILSIYNNTYGGRSPFSTPYYKLDQLSG